MSKPYFTKLIPVEGEIKEGDAWLHPQGAIFPYNHNEAATKAAIEYKFKPVKLFLCSRDIKLNDVFKFKLDNGNYAERKATKEYIKFQCFQVDENKYQVELKYDCFKVIGEVSPEAIWVKAGMEFDKDEWNYAYINEELAMIDKDYFHSLKIKPQVHIVFKCSQCNTFH